MNWRMEQLLAEVRKNPVTSRGMEDWKKCAVTRDFTYEGKDYHLTEPPEIVSFDACVAKRLVGEQKLVIVQGGYCDKRQIKIDASNSLYCFLPWAFEPASAGVGLPPDPFDQLLLRVRLLKHVQVVTGINLKPGDQIFYSVETDSRSRLCLGRRGIAFGLLRPAVSFR